MNTPTPLPATSWVEVQPGGPVCGSIRPPGSKSLTNRALVCAALAGGVSRLSGVLDSEDTRVMLAALERVGIDLRVDMRQAVVEVHGCGGDLPSVLGEQDSEAASDTPRSSPARSRSPLTESGEIDLFIANSGTTIRFLTAALSALGGRYRLHGVPRMHERPIQDLVDALVSLGDRVETLSPGGCPPVRITSQGWKGSRVQVAGGVSSQYLSGLLMAAPACQHAVEIAVQGELVSRPYVDMTIALMADFGVEVREPQPNCFVIDADAHYRGLEYAIEPDASAASYHWAAAAITGGSVTVVGLGRDALQGDVRFVEVLAKMGCQVRYDGDRITVSGRAEHGVDVDMNEISDCVQTLAVVALFAKGPTRVRGVGHNRFKETDRIGDLACELRKLGAEVEEHPDGLTIEPQVRKPYRAVLETYHDHRMAMSLSLAGLQMPGVRILNPSCTEKTYPRFFSDLETLIGRSHQWGGDAGGY